MHLECATHGAGWVCVGFFFMVVHVYHHRRLKQVLRVFRRYVPGAPTGGYPEAPVPSIVKKVANKDAAD